MTPQVLCPDSTESDEHKPVSVRALTSRFESATVSNDSRTENCSAKSVQNSESASQLGLVKTLVDPYENSRVTLQRQRSKSESESLAVPDQPPRPKSVLAKKGKSSDRLNKPRKSVTFSEDICLVSAADNTWGVLGGGNNMAGSIYQSDNKLSQISYRKTEDTDSSASDSPVDVVVGEGACTLCHKQGVEIGQSYCAKCTYYMSRFTPR